MEAAVVTSSWKEHGSCATREQAIGQADVCINLYFPRGGTFADYNMTRDRFYNIFLGTLEKRTYPFLLPAHITYIPTQEIEEFRRWVHIALPTT